MTELDEVKAALANNSREIAESLDRMEQIRREGVRRDLKAGRKVLSCVCDECLTKALALELPNPRTCVRARSMMLADAERD